MFLASALHNTRWKKEEQKKISRSTTCLCLTEPFNLLCEKEAKEMLSLGVPHSLPSFWATQVIWKMHFMHSALNASELQQQLNIGISPQKHYAPKKRIIAFSLQWIVKDTL